ncbi:MAG: hypothetical protein QM713_10245 [Arachnia sp.]
MSPSCTGSSVPPRRDQPGFLGVTPWEWVGGPSVAQTVLIVMTVCTAST